MLLTFLFYMTFNLTEGSSKHSQANNWNQHPDQTECSLGNNDIITFLHFFLFCNRDISAPVIDLSRIHSSTKIPILSLRSKMCDEYEHQFQSCEHKPFIKCWYTFNQENINSKNIYFPKSMRPLSRFNLHMRSQPPAFDAQTNKVVEAPRITTSAWKTSVHITAFSPP